MKQERKEKPLIQEEHEKEPIPEFPVGFSFKSEYNLLMFSIKNK